MQAETRTLRGFYIILTDVVLRVVGGHEGNLTRETDDIVELTF